ncbi:MAG: hypothetical protein KF915_07790 [Polyangiaceae bacterium]|nr:hypothetical protein [Polyangiaceae bacterium]
MSDAPPLSLRTSDYSLELVKLLLQVVWADHEVSAEEASRLRDFAREQGLGEAQLTELDGYLQGSAPLPPPNLGMLRAHRVEVMKSVRALLVQLGVGADEDDILSELSALLG